MILENTCNLCVIAVVSDSASCNRSFVKLHRSMSKADADVVYRTVNLYHPSLYMFFAGAPHLMKTTRNCMYHSGTGAGIPRLMWNDGREIVWNHLVRADLCMMDKSHDLLNIKNDIEHTTSIKDFLTPFISPNDKRFKWLINEFLSYFEKCQFYNS